MSENLYTDVTKIDIVYIQTDRQHINTITIFPHHSDNNVV